MRRMDRCSVTVDTGGPVIGYCNRTGNNSNSKKKKKMVIMEMKRTI